MVHDMPNEAFYEAQRNSPDAEKCINDCDEPATHRDVDGVPLCEGCWRQLLKYWSDEEEGQSVGNATPAGCSCAAG